MCVKLDLDMTTEKDPSFNIDGIIEDTDGGCKTKYLGNVQACLRKCNYHIDSELYNLQSKCNTNSMFSTLTVNCRSLSTHFDKFEYSLKSLNVNFDCITETWIKPVESIDSYNMTDYTFLSKPRMEKRGGGVGMYIANRLKFTCHQKVKFYYIHTKREKIQYQQSLNTSRWKQNKACQIHQIPRNIYR